MSIFKNKVYRVENFLRLVKYKQERLPNYDYEYCYAVYSKTNNIRLGEEIYIGNSVDFDENDQEIYPDFVEKNGYQYFCSDENIQDVIDLAVKQKPSVSDQELVDALNFYLENDNFMDV